ncbi:MAG TPA: Stp1/IreP family PP2C-type Ser/Thr phosphatase [Desulfotomaculum sp.]|nr:MAG: Protein serine/threonine phosphatase [Desulfotomaculum sp. 46_80]HAG09838.1 Stp1/IreP family PP2C-type Ser/Thr phosphatase [Desulfotomaculum sp.]HBY03887.1 Stp1/IreP family PP2C-type Ser/Thr phosphatase [Desulfotomaculum sp.]
MRWSQASDIGSVRTVNEDSICVRPELGFFAVADGMGGNRSGEVASRKILQELESFLIFYPDQNQDPGVILAEGVKRANKAVYVASFKSEDYHGMGTTLSCIIVRGDTFYLAHVGDSRIYLFRNGTIVQLTQDHSVVQEMQNEGVITKEEARNHPYRHVLTRALGVELNMETDIDHFQLLPGDIILLCSDGLSGFVSDETILQVVLNAADLDQAVNALVQCALNAGGADNVSVVLVAVD